MLYYSVPPLFCPLCLCESLRPPQLSNLTLSLRRPLFTNSRHGNVCHDFIHDRAGGDLAEAAFWLEDHAVGEDGTGDPFHVIGKDEISAAEGGHGLGGA